MADKATPLPVSLLADIGRPLDTRIGHDSQALGARTKTRSGWTNVKELAVPALAHRMLARP